ncbi:hypothetical protein ACX12E_07020 [Paenibacillus vandeheii]
MQTMDDKYVDSNVKYPHESGNYRDFFYSPWLGTRDEVISQSESRDLFLQQSYIHVDMDCTTQQINHGVK